MPNYTVGNARVALQQPDLTTFQANGSVVLDSRRVRPLWFDGRFLDARDLEQEQNYFLQRQSDLGQASGFEVVNGLTVDQTNAAGQFVGAGAIVLHAGEGVTPAGEMVSVPSDLTIQLSSLPEQPILDVQFGLSKALPNAAKKRTGLYVLGIQPMEYTSTPITSYPTTVGGTRTTHDSDIVESTTVTLVPYPNPPTSYAAALQQGALARQIFVTGSPSTLPDSLLPLALVNVQQGVITWIDTYLVRRDTGSLFSGLSFGVTDASAQQAYAMQYDIQLQSIVATRQSNGLRANFAASDYMLSLPSCGRYPLDAIDTGSFSQVFFPQEMDVRLSIIPSDEVPALLQDGLGVPAIDLTLASDAYASMAVFAFIPVPRSTFAALKSSLPDTPLNPILPQVLANRSPMQLLKLFQGTVNITAVSAVTNNAWATAIGSQQYGFYLRRPSDPTLVQFTTPTGIVLSSSANPSSFGQVVTFTAGLSPSDVTGAVEFFDGTTSLGSVIIAAGVATLDISILAVGAHPITATYAGDASDAAGKSAVLTQTVNKAAASITVASSANPSTVGQSVTFTANVLPASATGNVQFLDGAAVLGSAAVSAGLATLTVPSLSVGTHSITAVYDGDNNDTPATSVVLTQTVNKVSTSIALASSVDPSALGQSVTFTATVTPDTATGSVQFLDGGALLGTGTLGGNTATVAVSTLAAGLHSITAVYAGDANDNASTSAVLSQTVNKAITTVGLSSSLDPSSLGQSVLFTATLTPATATGSLQFLDGITLLNTATVTGGVATLPDATLTVGTHSITAVYSGDGNDAAATSAVLVQTVNKASSGVSLSSSANPSAVGQAVIFNAAISPATGTGTVQFLDGTAVVGNATVSAGVATLTDTSLIVGTHSITAAYSGDGNNSASISTPLTQTVKKAVSSVAVGSTQNPSSFGLTIKLSATVTPSTATGSVQFLDGTAALGTGVLAGGTAIFAAASLAVGTHSITAVYSGDGNDSGSTSPVFSQIVNKATANVTLTSAANPSTPGQSVIFTAKITPATATGSVEFFDGQTSIGTGTVNGGTATIADAVLTVGSHSITAVYNGDGNDVTGTSAALTQVVNQATPGVALSSSANPSIFGQAVTFTAKITSAAATGSVQFFDGTTSMGGAALNAGTATLADASLAIGTHAVTAVYSGDANDAGSTSAALTQIVNKVSTGVVLSSSVNPSSPGQPVIITAKVSPATATGTVEFLDGTAVLATNVLNAGVTTLTSTSLAIGTHSITAVYEGDANDSASTSPALAQVVNKSAAVLTLGSSINPSTAGQAVTFTAKVAPLTATGNVTFANNGVSLGAVALKGGQAQIVVQQSVTGALGLTVGTHTITATYPGDTNTAAASAQLIQTVNQIPIQ